MADDQVVNEGLNIPFDPDSLRYAPKVYSQYAQCTISTIDACLTFSHRRQIATDANSEPIEVAFPQAVVYMSGPHFINFADMVHRQAETLRRQIQALQGTLPPDAGTNQEPSDNS